MDVVGRPSDVDQNEADGVNRCWVTLLSRTSDKSWMPSRLLSHFLATTSLWMRWLIGDGDVVVQDDVDQNEADANSYTV